MSVSFDGTDTTADAGSAGAGSVDVDTTASTAHTETHQDVDTAGSSAADAGVQTSADAGAKSDDFDPVAVTRRALGLKDGATKEGTEGSPTPGEGDNAQGQNTSAEGKPPTAGQADEAKPEDDKLPFGKHPRFQQVLAERRQYQEQVASLEPDAQEMRGIRTFMSENDLSPQEVRTGFEIMRALKRDPARAVEMLRPYNEALGSFTGQTLPEDLRARVEDGVMDEASARELAAARNQHAFRTQQSEADNLRFQREQQARQEAASRQERASVVDGYVESQRTSDPDFSVKQPFLQGAVHEVINEFQAQGKPVQTAQAAREVIETAYRRVGERLRAVRGPDRRSAPMRPGVPSGMSSATQASPAPRTPYEATMAALRMGR